MKSKLLITSFSLLAAGAIAMSPVASVQAASGPTASDLRSLLTKQLGEHVLLAASATGAALGGRDAEFKAAAGALDMNSVDLSKSIGVVYGADAEAAFLPLWRKHIGFVVDYTTGLAAKDKAKQTKAVNDLVAYTQDFGAFLNSANPNLPKDVVAKLVRTHVLGLKDVIDAQAAKNDARAYTRLRTAYTHMGAIANALAGGIAKQFPEMIEGDAASADAALRAALNQKLGEHAYVAGMATGAALGGRDKEFKASATALDANSVEIAKAIGSVYGKTAQDAFLPLWRKHIGFVVDYTTGLATKDMAKSDKAVNDLVAYTQDFGAFLASANPNLPKEAVAELVKTHILGLKDAIDAQAAGDPVKAYAALRMAYAHMSMIADPLAAAIVKQFPEKFPAVTTGAADQGAMADTKAMAAKPMAAKPMAVEIKTFQFGPNALEVPVGATVTWTNADDIEHTVTSGAPGKTTNVFDDTLTGKGKTFSFKFDKAGEYAYFCLRHNSMVGKIVVK